MEEQYKVDIRDNFYSFSNKITYLQDVFHYAQTYRNEKYSDLMAKVIENDYSQFIEKFGHSTLKEFNNLDLFFTYTWVHSIFISAYSLFELQLKNISQVLETEFPLMGSIPNKKSLIERYRKFLFETHNIQSANQNDKNWKSINTNFREVRNAIVHDESSLKIKVYNDLQNFLNSYTIHVDPKTYEFRIININFIKDFFTIIKSYTYELVKEIAPVRPLLTKAP